MVFTDAEINLEFDNYGDVCGGGTPTLKNYSSEKTELRMPNHLTCGTRIDRIFAGHEFGLKREV